MLKYRDYTPADGEMVASWVTDEHTMRIWSAACFASWPVTGEQLTALLEERHAKDPTFRPLIVEEDGVPVGHIMVKMGDPEKNMIHIGLFILNPELRGKGLGSRMLRFILDELIFGEMDADLADLRVFLCNTPARACYEKLGFREMGTGVISMNLHGEVWDAVDLVIGKETIG